MKRKRFKVKLRNFLFARLSNTVNLLNPKELGVPKGYQRMSKNTANIGEGNQDP